MKTLLVSLFLLGASAQAAELTFTCQGRNLILDQLQKIEWSQQSITLSGLMNGKPYSLTGQFERTFSGNGFGYTTTYGSVIIPFDLINGKSRTANIELSSYDYPNEKASCTRD
ncbi:MAG: hypothetical protein ACXVB9_09475 [Bdellovibrionota bacterium]